VQARFCLIVALIAGLSVVSFGQSAARPDRGIRPVGSYSISDLENVSMTNGNVNLSMPLASLPPVAGGKLSWVVRAIYNSKLYDVTGTEVPPNPPVQGYTENYVQLSATGGWQVGGIYLISVHRVSEDYVGIIPTDPGDPETTLLHDYVWKMVLTTPDGATHELRPVDYSSYPGTRDWAKGYYKDTPATIQPQATMRYYSLDGSFLYARIDPFPGDGYPTNWEVYLPDGTRVSRNAIGTEKITDTNGNQIWIYSEVSGTTTTTHYQDRTTCAAGTCREILDIYNSATNTAQIQYQTVGGTPVTIDVNLGTTHVQGRTYRIGDPCLTENVIDTEINVVRSIVLPQSDLGPRQQFAFSYNSDITDTVNIQWKPPGCGGTLTITQASRGLGSLSQVVTPMVATVNYAYKYDGRDLQSLPPLEANDMPREPITQKTLTHDGTTDPWTYDIWFTSGVVTGPDGSVTTETFYPHDPAYASWVGGDKAGLVYRSNRSGKVLVERQWAMKQFFGGNNDGPGSLASFNPVVLAEYTTLMDSGGNPSVMAAKTFQYDYNGNQTSESDYDWFSPSSVSRDAQGVPTGVPFGLTPLRVTTNVYYNPATAADSANVYAKRDINTTAPLIVSALQITTTGGSQTRLSYDNRTYGTPPSNGAPAGNVTLEEHFDDGTASGGTAKWLPSAYGYDAYGNRNSITDPRGNVTSLVFDSSTHAQPISVTVDPNNQVSGDELTTSTVYDYWTGLVTSVTDPNQKTTTTVYTNQLLGVADPYGRPGVATDPQGRRTVTRYFDNARQVEVWSDLNSPFDALLKSRTTSDQLGRVVLTESSEDGASYTIFASTAYQQMGKITSTTNPMRSASASTDGWTRATKDDLGRVVTVETLSGRYPSGTSTGVVTTSYNAEQTTATDQAGKQRKSVVDGLGRLVKVFEDPAVSNFETDYSYDALGNLVQVDQGSQHRYFGYDSLSRLKQANNPESGIVNYTYNDNGNLQTKTDARGVVTTFAYDGLNRVLTRTYSGPAPGGTTPAVTYLYDTLGAALNGKGRLTSVSSSVSSYSYGSYDVMGRPLTGAQTTDGNNYSMSYQYNLAGGMTLETYPSNKVVVTEYDSAGRIAGVKNQATGLYYAGATATDVANRIQYAAHGAVSTMKLGNNLIENTTFNSRLQSTFIKLGTSSNPTSVLQLGYEYTGACQAGNNGNVMRQTIAAPGLSLTQDYCYDSLNRLASASENSGANWSQTYDYDRYGNRAVRTSSYMPTPRQTPTSNSPSDLPSLFNQSNNRIIAILSGEGTTQYSYDLAGNLSSMPDKVQGNPSNAMTYDSENRQATFNGTAGQYFYDGDGHRVKKIDSSGTTIFVYNASGQLVAEYHSDPVPPAAGGGGTSYLTSDHLGSTRVVTKADGSVKARYDYLSFGEEIPSTVGGRSSVSGYSAADSTRQKFTQKERDNESGLDYFGARYLSSAQGRFTSVDPAAASGRPIRPQSWNRYAYVLNNPLRLIDPDGTADQDTQKPKVVVVVFSGGNRYSDGGDYSKVQRMKAGGSTEGLGEDVIDAEAPHIAQKIKNDFPDADVRLAGPGGLNELTNDLVTNKPDHIIIEGYSAGGVSAVGLTNQLTKNGQSVDQLTTVDPRTGTHLSGVSTIANPGMVGDAKNYYVPHNVIDNAAVGPVQQVGGANNELITKTAKPGTPIEHKTADDITSPAVINRVEKKLNEIYNKPN
jgi:RHS repeat-associated protein